MQLILYPFKNIVFNKNSVLLDASFLISLIYDDDIKHSDCLSCLKQLSEGGSVFYTTSIITAEVMNKILYKLFISDIQCKINNVRPYNSMDNIRSITNSFSRHDTKILKEKKKDRLIHIPYKRYFDNISKNSMKRNLLNIYYSKSVEIISELEKIINIKYLNISEECIFLVKKFMCDSLLSVNDAFHIATAERNNIDFFLTLDGDFIFAESSEMKILKI
ncbi:type II toxin-antitoxin system VapC family toxin [Clostridium estertheticum]|uniref:PIN domain-containing protein n=2 Tax=Clostridium estertheticum TaxID=238834 RepID=A0A1J0GBF2_9CLOT|nr:type II toxin-antitoxin system VapC family toxin [Clostridium estertheticum]APC38681.1 PIN domain-containing protein [Clostridium estertheticum subsp. estertheticum]MBU3074716.1 type II toxin-antitoxin system VapC family toxin [Clostridium estertheticum]MBU3164572.1 type II toxin-antitoxin system VapC family toxin [Clostridium estertheticum]MBU3174240.1 type II toxin-antitoxin system VapC family toxin [Clostridium estertheticum]MBU3185494.1 type II toxin-antitoxin system VapC family toxin [